MYLTYGILFGVGASMAYTPSLVILGHYFKKYLGVVNGFVTAGSSVFTIAMPYALAFLLGTVKLEATMMCMSALTAVIMFCALLFKPLPGTTVTASDQSPRFYKHSVWRRVKSAINTDIWRKKKYVIWALAVPSALFGYFVPYVHLVSCLICVVREWVGYAKTQLSCILLYFVLLGRGWVTSKQKCLISYLTLYC